MPRGFRLLSEFDIKNNFSKEIFQVKKNCEYNQWRFDNSAEMF